MYCYLQISLHRYRKLLLLPFAVSLVFSYVSLHFPLCGDSFSVKKAPQYSYLNTPTLETLQISKVKQCPKAILRVASVSDVLVETIYFLAQPARIAVGHLYLASHSISSYHPPALFPNRASPAL
jgi:hypothetical protein